MRSGRQLVVAACACAVVGLGVGYAAQAKQKTDYSTARAPADASVDDGQAQVYARIDIDRIGPDGLRALKERLRPVWSVEADDKLLVLTTEAALANARRPYGVLTAVPEPDKLFIVHEAHDSILQTLESDVLVKGGRHAVVQARTGYLQSRLGHPAIEPFRPDIVLARQAANDEPAPTVNFRDDVTTLVGEVSGDRWKSDVQTLAGYNRYTHGQQVAQARDWLVAQLSQIQGLEVTTESFQVSGTTAYNVVARLQGTSRPDDWYIVGAHYDSISQSPSSTAPGAEDNGSGTAGMVEMARLLAAHRPAATILFIAFSGEEEGLYGSYAHAAKIVSAGDKAKVKGVINMDMIGYTGDADLDCLLESDQRGSTALFDTLKAAAARYTTLRIVTSLNPWGSDHVPYIEKGIPSVLTIENDWDEYPAYHRTNDKPENTSVPMAVETLKMNVAVLAQLAGSGE